MNYVYKQKQYEILDKELELKNPETREWHKAVLYRQIETGLKFVREESEFFKLFREVE